MTVGSRGDSLSEVSAIVKSDRVEMLMDGECAVRDPGAVSVSGVAVDSGGGG